MSTIRNWPGIILGGIVTAFTALMLGAQPALADVVVPIAPDPLATPTYSIDMDSACRTQYPTRPGIQSSARYLDPYSWVCTAPVTISDSNQFGVSANGRVPGGSFDMGRTTESVVVSGLRLDDWCRENHSGTSSQLLGSTANDWACVENYA